MPNLHKFINPFSKSLSKTIHTNCTTTPSAYKKSVSIYVHWPYCSQICPYCDFNKYLDPRASNTSVNYESHEMRMGKTLITELQYFLRLIKSNNSSNIEISSVYFGGGTPSLAKPQTFAEILAFLQRENALDVQRTEVTLEANPSDCKDRQQLIAFKEAGINRISLGIQALDDQSLNILGRKHNSQEARTTAKLCQSVFPKVSFDLIYGRPNQTTESWKNELLEAIQLGTGHLSLYSLTIEPKTKFHRLVQSNKLILPDDKTSAELFQLSQEVMTSNGFIQYEVSNFAKPNHQSQHNLHYWKGGDYIGIGPGAAGRLTIPGTPHRTAFRQVLHPNQWMKHVEEHGHGIMEQEELSKSQAIQELFIYGLRKTEGIDRSLFQQIAGANIEQIIDEKALQELIQRKLIFCDEKGIRSTPEGILVLDGIVSHLSSNIRV